MDTTMDNGTLQSPAVFSNDKILLSAIALIGVVSMVLSVAMALLAIGEILPPRGFSIPGILSAATWLLCAVVTWQLGWVMWKLALRLAANHARFDSQGVDFEVGSRRKPEKWFMGWDQIAAIRYQRTGNSYVYWIVGKDGSSFQYTPYTFFRARKLAREISARCGRPIEQVPDANDCIQ